MSRSAGPGSGLDSGRDRGSPAPLDVALVLKRSAEALGRDFAGIALAGLALIVVPALVGRSLAGEWGTLLVTLRGVCAMLFIAIVGGGIVARLQGAPRRPVAFVARGIAAAQTGVQVGLLVGAAVVVGLTVQLFARHGTAWGWVLDSLLLAGGLLAVSIFLPLVPAAVAEALPPRAAFRRAAALTEGNRNRILALALLTALTLAPAAAIIAGLGGDGPGPVAMAVIELIAGTLAAAVPAVTYVGLREAA